MHHTLKGSSWRHLPGVELRGKTFGFVGLGMIAAEVAPVVRARGTRAGGRSLTHDEARAKRLGVELVTFDEVLCQSDGVALFLRASPRASGVVGRRELGRMKPTVFLVSTARGALVDVADRGRGCASRVGSESAGPDGDDSTGGPAGSEIGRRSTAVPFLHDQLVKASAPGARRTRANPHRNRAILDSDQRHDASQHVRQERLVGVGKVVGPE